MQFHHYQVLDDQLSLNCNYKHILRPSNLQVFSFHILISSLFFFKLYHFVYYTQEQWKNILSSAFLKTESSKFAEDVIYVTLNGKESRLVLHDMFPVNLCWWLEVTVWFPKCWQTACLVRVYSDINQGSTQFY